MTLPLTTEVLAAAYDFLSTTPPYCDWNMPESDDVKFIVNRKLRSQFAQYQWTGEKHSIIVSAASNGHTSTLLESLGHEMIHLHLEKMGWESRGNESVHNAAFRKFAARACKFHGWDPKAFY